MASYKVIQDIEAEDKLVGPFSLRQFIYVCIAVFLGYLSFISVAKGAAWTLIVLVPPMLFCMFFAWPWTPDQPTEVWALARLRFYLKPRKRVWDQSGIKELVTITVPKRIEKIYTNGLSQTEVQSRLQALATTIDSRGWAIKNVNVNMGATVMPGAYTSDRLLDPLTAFPQAVSDNDVTASDDILDERNNPVASQFDHMIDASTQAHRQKIMARLQQDGATVPTSPTANGWFMSQPTAAAAPIATTMTNPNPIQPLTQFQQQAPAVPAVNPSAADESLISEHLRERQQAQQYSQSHMRNIVPDPAPQQPVQPQAASKPVPAQPDAAILKLAGNNDLNVATLAREAKKAKAGDLDNEVVVTLH